jgi:hypothetical protein
MWETLKSYVHSLPRHFRYLILVPATITETRLRNIIGANLHIWGGRYNPIIPVEDNKITTDWLNTIRYYDADVVFYERGLNIEQIKQLLSSYPREYQEFLDDRRPYFPGVNIHSLLHQDTDGKIIRKGNLKLCHTEGAYQFENGLMEFYKMNLGIQDLYHGEDKFLRTYEIKVIDKESSPSILETIVTFDPYFKSLLSTLVLNTTYLEGSHYSELNRTELIVYNDSNCLDDLLYFWNRQRYLKPENELQQIVVSTSELEKLLKNQNLNSLLYRISYSRTFTITSRTLDSNALKIIRNNLQEACPNCSFSHSFVANFPYEIKHTNFLITGKLKKTKQVIIGKSDNISNPESVFNPEGNRIDGPHVLDIEIERSSNDQHRYLKFPYHTPLFHLVTPVKSRVNRYHLVSIFLEAGNDQIKINVPTDEEVTRTLLSHREIEGKLIDLPCRDVFISNAGQKLTAFLTLFENNWEFVDQFISDRFWLDLFRYDSPFSESPIRPGKGIFSYQDLEVELRMLYKMYSEDFKKKIEETIGETITDEYLENLTKRYIKDDFELYIDSNLQYLVKNRGLFIGMKVGCPHCGSNKWYSLSELNDAIDCKGCYQKIMPGIKSPIYYKLSETIISNLLSDQTKNSKTFDGNYVVLRTLSSLKKDYKNCYSSFMWSPPLGISYKTASFNRKTDIDIIAIQEGKLVYGEAKNNAKEFNKKEIEFLTWIGNNLFPDVIVLGYASGKLTDQIEKIRSGITNPNCEVIAMKTWKPWYRFRGLFGMPIDSEEVDLPEK